MTIHERMIPRTEREKDLLKYGRSQEKVRIIKLLEDPATMSNWWSQVDKNLGLYGNLKNYVIALIKKEK